MRNSIPTLRVSLALAALLLAHCAAAQDRHRTTDGATAAVRSIDGYTREVDRYVSRHQGECRIFANVAANKTKEKEDRWREFKTQDARNKADAGDNLNENADVCFKDGKVAAAHFMFQSPSRDWAHFVLYYFRADGTLAKLESTLNTFYGHVTARREKYFDAHGKLLQQTEHFYKLGTTRKEPKPRGGSDEFIDEPIPIYQKVSDLPFSNLLDSQKLTQKSE